MKIIGLTGGIGSGKTTLAGFLKELGVAVIDADKLGHQALRENQMRREVVATFGQGVLDSDSQVDRPKLARLVFGYPQQLARLNRITHPRIAEMLTDRLDEHRRQGVGAVVIEAPLLVETGWVDTVDEVWVTVAPRTVVLTRLQQMGFTRREVLTRLGAQMKPEERLKKADVVINTDTSLEELKARAKELADTRL
ncbi:MAG: dephospho-CoA kinase [Dehalococcoidales bacterium]